MIMHILILILLAVNICVLQRVRYLIFNKSDKRDMISLWAKPIKNKYATVYNNLHHSANSSRFISSPRTRPISTSFILFLYSPLIALSLSLSLSLAPISPSPTFTAIAALVWRICQFPLRTRAGECSGGTVQRAIAATTSATPTLVSSDT